MRKDVKAASENLQITTIFSLSLLIKKHIRFMLLDETSQKKGSKNDQITFAILPPPPPKIVILLTFSDFYVILVFPRQKYEISTSREFVNCEAWYVW